MNSVMPAKRHFDPGFLRTSQRITPAADVVRIPSAGGKRELLWNTSLNNHYILRLPSIDEIESLVRKIQSQLLATIWEESVVAVSADARTALGFVHRGGTHTHLSESWVRKHPNGVPTSEARRWPLKRQQKFLASIAPATLEEAVERGSSTWVMGYVRAPAIAPTQNGMNDSEEWLEHFFGLFTPDRSRMGLIFLICTLLELKERGIALMPQRAVTLFSQGVGQYLQRHPDQIEANRGLGIHLRRIAILHDQLKAELGDGFSFRLTPQGFLESKASDDIGLRTHDLLLATNYSSPEDISWGFCEAFKHPIEFRLQRRYGSSRTLSLFLAKSAIKNEGPRVVEKVDPFLPGVIRAAGGLDDLPKWCEGLGDFRANITGIKLVGPIGRYVGIFLAWLRTQNPALKEPRNLTRAHVTNGANSTTDTFVGFVAKLPMATRGKNQLLAKVFQFIGCVFDRNNLHLPLKIEDMQLLESRFEKDKSKTHRARVASYILDDLRRLLLLRKGETFEWSRWAQDTKELINGEYIFCPILPAIIFLLLRWPLRGNQVRYFDSGEFDSMIHNFNTRTFEPNLKGDAQRKKIGEPHRAMGVIQPAQTAGAFDAAHDFDLQVAINKRKVGEAAEYTIPYVDDETYWVIGSVIEWQKKYGQAPVLVREHTDPQSYSVAQDLPTVNQLPWLCCLFRDPRKASGHPPGPNRVGLFWDRLCVEYDRRNNNWTNPATGEIGPRPLWPKMSASKRQLHTLQRFPRGEEMVKVKKERIYHYAIHDIHSLRVSGISFLLDRGLPLAVVAAIAGHGSLQMTLRYFVLDGREVRKRLSEVLRERPELQLQAGEIERRLLDIKTHKDWLLGSTESAFTALQRAVLQGGIWRLSPTGICPGTSCAEGLRLKSVFKKGPNERTLVPGSLCGLCAFRIYGPPFLPGLVKEFNETLYALERIISRQKELRQMRMQAEADGRIDQAAILRDEDEQLTIQSEPDCAHVARLYEMINECLAFTDQRKDESNSPKTLLSVQPTNRPKAEISQVGQFEQMVEILATASLLPASKSVVPSEVSDRFQLRLLNLLAKNGVEPFLAGLPDDVARAAALEFAELLMSSVPKRSDLENVFAGRILLREIGLDIEQQVVDGARSLSQKYEGSTKTLR